jgi:hypothetical protein
MSKIDNLGGGLLVLLLACAPVQDKFGTKKVHF